MSLADRWPLPDHHDLRDELLTAWDRPGYHDRLHLAEVLDRLELLASSGAGFDLTTVALAGWFHDAVYDGGADDEERSAQWAERVLPAAYADEVARLVRMTGTFSGARTLASLPPRPSVYTCGCSTKRRRSGESSLCLDSTTFCWYSSAGS